MTLPEKAYEAGKGYALVCPGLEGSKLLREATHYYFNWQERKAFILGYTTERDQTK